jgi:hypothetical protein
VRRLWTLTPRDDLLVAAYSSLGEHGPPRLNGSSPYFLAGIVILETVIASPFISPVNVTPA